MNIRVASPCKASWDTMTGDERVRYCTLCSLNVYNFAEMTADEIRALLLQTEGRVCGRLYRRADGTLLTRDCPTALQALRQRVSRFSAAVIAAFFSVSAFASAGKTCDKPQIQKTGAKLKLTVERAVHPQRATFTGVVRDESGDHLLPGVNVIVRDESSDRELTTVTDENGAFTFSGVEDGIYSAMVELPGFTPAIVEHLALQQNEVTRARVTMRFNSITVTMGALTVVDAQASDQPLSTTFSHDFVSKLPISGQP